MIWKITITIVILIALVFLFSATKPKTFHIQRSISIDAPADKIFALIDDLHNWDQWAPQDKEDSSAKKTYSGPVHGAGCSRIRSPGPGIMTSNRPDRKPTPS
jgi:hypothetical protein